MGVGKGMSKGRGVVVGGSGHRLLHHLFTNHRMRGGRDANENSQLTGTFVIFIARGFSRAVEFVVNLGALGKISMALT